MGRSAAGVRAMRPREGDTVAAADVLHPDEARDLLVVTSNGAAKRTAADLFPRKGRGGLGVIGVKLPGADAHVVGARLVDEDDEMLLVSSSGVLIRTRVADISRQGRAASGVRAMSLGEGETVVATALVDLPDLPDAAEADSEPRENPSSELTPAT